jgi:hypothetical protein
MGIHRGTIKPNVAKEIGSTAKVVAAIRDICNLIMDESNEVTRDETFDKIRVMSTKVLRDSGKTFVFPVTGPKTTFNSVKSGLETFYKGCGHVEAYTRALFFNQRQLERAECINDDAAGCDGFCDIQTSPLLDDETKDDEKARRKRVVPCISIKSFGDKLLFEPFEIQYVSDFQFRLHCKGHVEAT